MQQKAEHWERLQWAAVGCGGGREEGGKRALNLKVAVKPTDALAAGGPAVAPNLDTGLAVAQWAWTPGCLQLLEALGGHSLIVG